MTNLKDPSYMSSCFVKQATRRQTVFLKDIPETVELNKKKGWKLLRMGKREHGVQTLHFIGIDI